MLFSALLAVGLICLGIGVIITKDASPSVTPTFVPLPLVRANDVITHLRQIGLALGTVQMLAVPNTTWAAHQETRFTLQQNSESGIFIVLSYPSAELAGSDAFRARYDKTWNSWQLLEISNVLFLAAPNAAPLLTAQLESHLTSYLVVPYRPGLPTATPGIP